MPIAQLVSEFPVPRASTVPTVAGVKTPFFDIDGSLTAGNRVLLGTDDALAEQIKLDFDSNDDVRTLIITVEMAHSAHEFNLRLTTNPGDVVAGADRLNTCTDCKTLGVGTHQILVDSALIEMYVIAVPKSGTTAASVAGRVYIEGGSHE